MGPLETLHLAARIVRQLVKPPTGYPGQLVKTTAIGDILIATLIDSHGSDGSLH